MEAISEIKLDLPLDLESGPDGIPAIFLKRCVTVVPL